MARADPAWAKNNMKVLRFIFPYLEYDYGREFNPTRPYSCTRLKVLPKQTRMPIETGSKLASLFRKKKPESAFSTELEFRWRTFKLAGREEHSRAVAQIYENELDGLVIQNYFSVQELSKIQTAVKLCDTSIRTVTPFGQVIGKKLKAKDGNFQKLTLDDYFSFNAEFASQLPLIIGHDFEASLKPVLEGLSGASPSLPVAEDGRPWNPATIRICQPGGGGIQTHVGNEFNEKMPENCLLGSMALIHDQLSFFVLLQKPVEGGELVLYDASWENTEHLVKQDQATARSFVESQRAWKVPLEEGDLIIFAGGRIWHCVHDCRGDRERITMGGFLAYSKDRKKLYYWS